MIEVVPIHVGSSITVAGPAEVKLVRISKTRGISKATFCVSEGGKEIYKEMKPFDKKALVMELNGNITHLHLVGLSESLQQALLLVVPRENLLQREKLSLDVNVRGRHVSVTIANGIATMRLPAGVHPWDVCSAICAVAGTDPAVNAAIHPQAQSRGF